MSRKQQSALDVIIVGGGIMGTSTAFELAERGLQVVVLEKSIPGAEASSAAAGILGPETEAHEPGPMLDLCRYSKSLYKKWVQVLESRTQVPTGYLEGGCFEVALSQSELSSWKKTRAFQIKEGKAQVLSAARLKVMLPAVTEKAVGAIFLPDECRITPPDLFRATRIAAEQAGVSFVSGRTVSRVLTETVKGEKQRACGVEFDDRTSLAAGAVVIAAGSWTPLISGLPLKRTDIIPARGQIVELRLPSPIASSLLFGSDCYLVPRADGRVVVGSTLEFVGFQRGVTAKGVRDLLTSATALLPELEQAELTGMWSSFRPYTNDHLPLLGETGVTDLIMASGHYRTGILLAPATAKIVADLLTRKKPKLDLRAFNPLR